MYTIFKFNGHTKRVEANVESIAAAETYLAGLGDVIMFEVDPDGADAADAAVLKGGALDIYAVEGAR